ncbi:hypothetical protein QMK19_35205 [Streptomyces sp. H10-C2]|nr:hypothetical protein [Streptomyces sp. PH10-H1]MDJ0345883.1 hypothetical protein [Streptomyces sp. PH10-H1]MDJ0374732.1 hypothetical protein [Streptomyces sp. H10-C2]
MAGSARYEIKADGYRVAALIGRDSVRLQSRAGRDMTSRFPQIAAALARVEPGAILDGELVASTAGHMSFGALQRFQPGRPAPRGVSLTLVVFDVLQLPSSSGQGEGVDVRAGPGL